MRMICSKKQWVIDGEYNHELIKQEIEKVAEIRGCFPSSQYLRQNGYCDLDNAIQRSGGFKYWRETMEDKLVFTNNIGDDGEETIQTKLESLGYKVTKETRKNLYDLTVNDNVRVECKLSHISLFNGFEGYSCNLHKHTTAFDILIVICRDKENNDTFYVIPHTKVFNHSQISFGINKSKWDKYIDNFQIIDKYNDFYNSLN